MIRQFLVSTLIVAVLVASGAAATGQVGDDQSTCTNGTGDEKIIACSKLIARGDNVDGALISRAEAYWRKGDFDRAIVDLDEAIRRNPKNVSALGGRGEMYRIKGKLDQAISDLDESIRLDPKYLWGFARRGEAYRQKGNFDRAIADLDAALRINPNDAFARGSRAEAYRQKGAYDQAISEFDETIRLAPQNPFAFASRGEAHRLKGHYDRALPDLDEAIRLDPKYAFAYAARGEAYRQKGNFDRAIADLDEAIRLNPTYKWAIARREEARQDRNRAPAATVVAPSQGQRVALIIGNGSYRKMPVLSNPYNDASDIGEELRRVGFDVQVETNLDRGQLNNAIGRFSKKVDGAEIAIFYYAGHGMQFQGKNYLLPVDADLESSSDVNKFKLLLIDDVIDVLSAANGLQLIVLDACRNNPVEQEFKAKIASTSGGSRDTAMSRGFARLDPRSGLLLAYATAPNSTASDGGGRNSPFTSAFLNNLKRPNLEVRQMLFRVQSEVYQATGKKQLPEISSLYIGPDLVLRKSN